MKEKRKGGGRKEGGRVLEGRNGEGGEHGLGKAQCNILYGEHMSVCLDVCACILTRSKINSLFGSQISTSALSSHSQ